MTKVVVYILQGSEFTQTVQDGLTMHYIVPDFL